MLSFAPRKCETAETAPKSIAWHLVSVSCLRLVWLVWLLFCFFWLLLSLLLILLNLLRFLICLLFIWFLGLSMEFVPASSAFKELNSRPQSLGFHLRKNLM